MSRVAGAMDKVMVAWWFICFGNSSIHYFMKGESDYLLGVICFGLAVIFSAIDVRYNWTIGGWLWRKYKKRREARREMEV